MNKKVVGLLIAGSLTVGSLTGYGFGNMGVAELQNQVTKLEKENKTLENKNNELENANTELEKNNKTLQDKVDKAKPWFEIKEEDRKELEEKLVKEKTEKEEAEKKAKEEAEAKVKEEKEDVEKAKLLMNKTTVISTRINKAKRSGQHVDVSEEVNQLDIIYQEVNKQRDKYLNKNSEMACAYAAIIRRIEILKQMIPCYDQNSYNNLQLTEAAIMRDYWDSIENLE